MIYLGLFKVVYFYLILIVGGYRIIGNSYYLSFYVYLIRDTVVAGLLDIYFCLIKEVYSRIPPIYLIVGVVYLLLLN
jgi:hypothetical protein